MSFLSLPLSPTHPPTVTAKFLSKLSIILVFGKVVLMVSYSTDFLALFAQLPAIVFKICIFGVVRIWSRVEVGGCSFLLWFIRSVSCFRMWKLRLVVPGKYVEIDSAVLYICSVLLVFFASDYTAAITVTTQWFSLEQSSQSCVVPHSLIKNLITKNTLGDHLHHQHDLQ